MIVPSERECVVNAAKLFPGPGSQAVKLASHLEQLGVELAMRIGMESRDVVALWAADREGGK